MFGLGLVRLSAEASTERQARAESSRSVVPNRTGGFAQSRPPAAWRLSEISEVTLFRLRTLLAPVPLSRRGVVATDRAAACLSLSAEDILVDQHQPQVLSVGLPFLVVELACCACPQTKRHSECGAGWGALHQSNGGELLSTEAT
jgi:hypothetical protein